MMRAIRAALAILLLSGAPAACGSPAANGSGDAGAPEATGGGQSHGTLILVDPQGNYSVTFAPPPWTFAGSLGSAARDIKHQVGEDEIGPYHEVTFTSARPAQTEGIRAYDSLPVVVFTAGYPSGASNPAAPFPTFDTLPSLPYHVTYGDDQAFAPVHFDLLLYPDSPFIFFDDYANTFILSAATDFLHTTTVRSPTGTISTGVDPVIANLPAGYSHKTILVAQHGINATYATWGGALMALAGKKLVPNDATPELERFGYWTDSGAYYYFNYEKSLGYPGTLVAVRHYFERVGLPIAYMQLDAWWYPKGSTRSWSHNVGMYVYEADALLFPKGLASFQKSLGLPLMTHANWIADASPYRSEYEMSGAVSIDPAFWSHIAGYIAAAGVTIYEPDFLNENALPITTNLTDQDAFLDEMASAMAGRGIAMQYSMALPRQYLQGTKYPNLLTTRVSMDHFERARYQNFFYASLLTSSLGAWPWSDVFYSTDTDNLLLSTLSAGMFGVGDAIGRADLANLRQTLRPDGVIVKPDVPMVPLDATFINQAKGVDTPMVSATYSDFGTLRESYVYAFNLGTSISASFSPAMLGHSGQVLVWNYFQNAGKLVDASATYTEDLGDGSDGKSSYYVVAPVGPSGIALLGDRGKFVSLGKKRVTHLDDDGTLSASLVFARGEGPVTLHGYAKVAPTVTAIVGAVGQVEYDGATRMFSVQVSPEDAAASITMH